jgi:FkbM family methyltransferase
LAIFVGGQFEPNEFDLLDRLLQPGMTVLDGGANEGAYTVFLAARVGPQGRVIALEPSPREVERLTANVALNDQAQVEVIEAALAETDGELELQLAESAHAGQNTLGAFIYTGVSTSGTVRVPTITIDKVVQNRQLMRLDVIKLDIEGGELRALSGARETLQRWRPLLLLEANPAALAQQGGSVRDILALLGEASYRALSLDADTATWRPISDAPLSDNLLAVHSERDWGLLAE